MTFYVNELPAEVQRRRALLVLDKVEAAQFKKTPEGAKLDLLEEVAVLGFSSAEPRRGEELRRLESEGRLPRGVRLVLNPFEDLDYREPEPLVLGLPVAKARLLRTLCQRLGAQRFQCEVGHRSEKGGEWKVGADVAGSKGGGGGLIKRAVQSLQSAQATLGGVYAGGEPDLEAARDLIRRSGLSVDRDVGDIIEAARYRNNAPVKLTFEVDLEREARQSLDLSARVTVPGAAKVSGEFKYESHEASRHWMKVRARV